MKKKVQIVFFSITGLLVVAFLLDVIGVIPPKWEFSPGYVFVIQALAALGNSLKWNAQTKKWAVYLFRGLAGALAVAGIVTFFVKISSKLDLALTLISCAFLIISITPLFGKEKEKIEVQK